MESRTIIVHGVSTLVAFAGEGRPLLCLHGWEASHWSFQELEVALKNVPVQIIAPDLPGFGESADPPEAWSVDDYADFIEDLVSELKLKDVLLLGHSFGGRMTIKLASRKRPWIAHLYLCSAAGIKQPRYWRRTVGIFLAECGNKVFSIPGLRSVKPLARKVLYKILRVHDYEKTSGVVRETMIKVINEDLTPLLGKITVETDLFWGEDDTMVPLKDAKLMNKKIVQSSLHTFPGVRHPVHRDRAREIAQHIKQNL